MIDKFKIIPITESSLERMPRRAAKRLRAGLGDKICHEFEEWSADMGYDSMMSSPMLCQLLYEAFIGGWGAKVRHLKNKKA